MVKKETLPNSPQLNKDNDVAVVLCFEICVTDAEWIYAVHSYWFELFGKYVSKAEYLNRYTECSVQL